MREKKRRGPRKILVAAVVWAEGPRGPGYRGERGDDRRYLKINTAGEGNLSKNLAIESWKRIRFKAGEVVVGTDDRMLMQGGFRKVSQEFV